MNCEPQKIVWHTKWHCKGHGAFIFYQVSLKWLLSWNCICKSPSFHTAMLQKAQHGLARTFLLNCHLLFGKSSECHCHIFLFPKPQVHLSSNKTSRKILSHLTEPFSVVVFLKEETLLSFVAEWNCPCPDSKGCHKCSARPGGEVLLG